MFTAEVINDNYDNDQYDDEDDDGDDDVDGKHYMVENGCKILQNCRA